MSLTLDEFKAMVAEIEEVPQFEVDNPRDTAALVILVALQEGATIEAVSAFTHIPEPVVETFARNLEEAGIWQDGITYADYEDEEEGAISFHLDTLVAQGILARVKPGLEEQGG